MTAAVHMALSCSSLIFHVLPHRIMARPLVIWEEYRLHAIVFTLRCISVYFFAIFYPFQNNDSDNIVQFCFVMTHHLVVDEITRRVGPGDNSNTTVRGKSANGTTSNMQKSSKHIILYYAFF